MSMQCSCGRMGKFLLTVSCWLISGSSAFHIINQQHQHQHHTTPLQNLNQRPFLTTNQQRSINPLINSNKHLQQSCRCETTQIRMSSTDDATLSSSSFVVMVNGMPGPMAVAAAEACLRKGLSLAPLALTGPDVSDQIYTVTDPITGNTADVRLLPSSSTAVTKENEDPKAAEIHHAVTALQETLQSTGSTTQLLAIDFTHPSAVNQNARFYVQYKIPFVMGTTGGDREQLVKDVTNHYCVIAPNMAKQIVAMQAAMEYVANRYPGAFDGYQLHVVESHQKTKADTSGTAKAVIDSIKTLAALPEYTYEDVELIRDDQQAIDFGVPETALKGHAFHTYTLTSADSSVQFALQHNVAGRTIYADGTADAVQYLAQRVRKDPNNPKVLNMIDVLEAGAM